MTTSYPLSLKLKELGVEQEGEFYWIMAIGDPYVCHKDSIIDESYILCRALTLGEVVRMLPDFTSILKLNGSFTIGGASYTAFIHNQSPEEAAGELLAELKQKEGSNG